MELICISSICSNVCRDWLPLKVGATIKWIWGIYWLCRDHSSHENVGSPSDDTGSVILEKNKILMTEFRYVSCHVIVLISWSK